MQDGERHPCPDAHEWMNEGIAIPSHPAAQPMYLDCDEQAG
jgi:hypothetical protein